MKSHVLSPHTYTEARTPMNVPTRGKQQAPQERETTTEEDSDSKSECKPTCTLAQADTHSTWQITLHNEYHNTESDEDDVTTKPQRKVSSSEVVIATPQYATITRRAGTDTSYTMLLYHYYWPACSTAVA